MKSICVQSSQNCSTASASEDWGCLYVRGGMGGGSVVSLFIISSGGGRETVCLYVRGGRGGGSEASDTGLLPIGWSFAVCDFIHGWLFISSSVSLSWGLNLRIPLMRSLHLSSMRLGKCSLLATSESSVLASLSLKGSFPQTIA